MQAADANAEAEAEADAGKTPHSRSALRAVPALLFRIAAALILVATGAAALHDVSYAWDGWYYHLPIAARLSGLLSAQEYALTPANDARMAGYPLLGEALQGLLWRATGRVESANLVAFAGVPLFAAFLARRFGVAWPFGVVLLFAIPLVQTHATSCYVDLPANIATAVVVLLAAQAWAERARPDARTVALGTLAAAVAANTKYLALPIAIVALALLLVRAVPWRALRERGAGGKERARAVATTAGLFALPIPACATCLRNLVRFGNPFYPVPMHLFGRVLPGPEAPYGDAPAWLEAYPRPARFVVSLLEIGLRSFGDPRRWTVDQWMPTESGANRLGGFFHAYVVANLIFLGWRLAVDRSRTTRVAAVAFGALTAFVSCMPQSHELRYYSVWMIVLVATNAWLAARGARLGALGAVAVCALGVVVLVTRGAYVYPSGSTFAELVAEKVDARAALRIPDGARVCVEKAPFTLLWAARFQRGERAPQYAVQEAERPEECGGAVPLETFELRP
jgi:hypothetical protein